MIFNHNRTQAKNSARYKFVCLLKCILNGAKIASTIAKSLRLVMHYKSEGSEGSHLLRGFHTPFFFEHVTLRVTCKITDRATRFLF